MWACNIRAPENNDRHAHELERPTTGYTLYSDSLEVFVECDELLVNESSTFAVHISKTYQKYEPLVDASVTVSLINGNSGIKNTAVETATPGIYQAQLRPKASGNSNLLFTVQSSSFSKTFTVKNVKVHSTSASIADIAKDKGDEVTFTKERAWQSELAIEVAGNTDNNDVINVMGELISKPGDVTVVSSTTSGMVKFVSANLIEGGAVKKGEHLFVISGNNSVSSNIDETIKLAKLEVEDAKAEYARMQELMNDKLVIKSEYRKAKLQYQSAVLRLNNLTNNYGSAGKRIVAPFSGYIKEIKSNDGDFVTDGQPLTTIIKTKQILLKADVPINSIGKLESIKEADFYVAQSDSLFNTKQLKGRIISVAQTASHNNSFVPIFFEMENQPGLLSGSRANVFLKLDQVHTALTIPVSSLLEEQGFYYVYLQKSGESFEKRLVKIASNNGKRVEITDGVQPGERVVTKGAYRLKLASQSTSMPVHDHHH